MSSAIHHHLEQWHLRNLTCLPIATFLSQLLGQVSLIKRLLTEEGKSKEGEVISRRKQKIHLPRTRDTVLTYKLSAEPFRATPPWQWARRSLSPQHRPESSSSKQLAVMDDSIRRAAMTPRSLGGLSFETGGSPFRFCRGLKSWAPSLSRFQYGPEAACFKLTSSISSSSHFYPSRANNSVPAS